MPGNFESTRGMYRKLIYHCVKVPLSFATITMGYILEFLVCLPFMLIMYFDELFKNRR